MGLPADRGIAIGMAGIRLDVKSCQIVLHQVAATLISALGASGHLAAATAGLTSPQRIQPIATYRSQPGRSFCHNAQSHSNLGSGALGRIVKGQLSLPLRFPR